MYMLNVCGCKAANGCFECTVYFVIAVLFYFCGWKARQVRLVEWM